MISARFFPEAEAEFAEAAEFYEAAEPGLGQAFTQEVERAVDRICAFPESGATEARSGNVCGRSTRSLGITRSVSPKIERFHKCISMGPVIVG